ncbi:MULTISPECIES: DUF6182 family protein [unclassified Streptomyces]|uniref:DUF6182 family protein n=1 Tax=unclassified Streptomyces TaxID=2593676 RepID=UPI0037F411E7
MTPTEQRLHDEAARRLRTARPDLATRHDLATLDGLMAAQSDIAGQDPMDGTLAVVILKRFDLAAWVRATCEYALSLGADRARAWRASFTRTVFLAGNPAHLTGRFCFAHVAEDLSAAWTEPGPAAETAALRRLLKLFDGPARIPAHADMPIEIPGAPSSPRAHMHRDLYLATAQCSVSDALVHLNHVLAEAVLDGLIGPGCVLTLRQVPRLLGVPAPLESVRVVTEHRPTTRLKAAAALTEEVTGA